MSLGAYTLLQLPSIDCAFALACGAVTAEFIPLRDLAERRPGWREEGFKVCPLGLGVAHVLFSFLMREESR